MRSGKQINAIVTSDGHHDGTCRVVRNWRRSARGRERRRSMSASTLIRQATAPEMNETATIVVTFSAATDSVRKVAPHNVWNWSASRETARYADRCSISGIQRTDQGSGVVQTGVPAQEHTVEEKGRCP